MEEQKTEKVEEVAQQPQVLNLIEEAKKIKDEMRAENDRREALLRQEQEMHTVQMLSGHAAAGYERKPETDDEKWEREAKIRYAGTGMDPTPRR